MNKILLRYPFLVPTLAFIVGVVCDMLLLPIWVAVLLGIFGVGVLIFSIVRRATPSAFLRAHRFQPLGIALIFLAVGFAADLYYCPDAIDFENDPLPKMVIAEVSEVRNMTYGDRCVIELEELCDSLGANVVPVHNVKAIVTAKGYNFAPHDRIIFRNALRPITQNPDYQNAGYIENQMRQGIGWRATINEGEAQLLPPCNDLSALFSRLREHLVIALEYSPLTPSTTAFLSTMLLGDADMLTPDDRKVFADAGISHILAVSGLHAGIIASMICLLTMPLVLLGWRRQRYIIAIILTWGYVLLAGAHVSAIRAAVMVSLVMGAAILERRNSSLNALCLAALLILLFSPRAILSPGMQFSFLCVSMIVCFGPRVNERLLRLPAPVRIVLSTAFISCLTVFGSWALTAYYFHSLPLLFLPVNLLILPLLPLYLVIAIAHLLAALAGLSTGLTAPVLDYCYDLLRRLCLTMGENGVMHLSVSLVTPVLWMLGLLLLGYFHHRGSRKMMVLPIATLGLAVASVWLVPGVTYTDGLIVRNNFSTIELAGYQADSETVSYVRPGASQAALFGGKKVCIKGVDAEPMHRFHGGCDILIIAGNTHLSLSQLCRIYSPKHVVFHNTLNTYRHELFCSEAQKNNIDYHDMKENGTLQMLD